MDKEYIDKFWSNYFTPQTMAEASRLFRSRFNLNFEQLREEGYQDSQNPIFYEAAERAERWLFDFYDSQTSKDYDDINVFNASKNRLFTKYLYDALEYLFENESVKEIVSMIASDEMYEIKKELHFKNIIDEDGVLL